MEHSDMMAINTKWAMVYPFQVNIPFYSSWKYQEKSGFLTFSGDMEKVAWNGLKNHKNIM